MKGKRGMRKKRILLYNYYFTFGGAEVFLKYLAKYLADVGYDVTVAAAPRVKEDYHHPFGPKVRYVWRPSPKRGPKKHSVAWILDHAVCKVLVFFVDAYLSMRKYDIVVAVKDKWLLRYVLRIRGLRKFAWVHVDYSTYSFHTDCFASREEEVDCMRKFEKIVCVSDTARKGVIKTLGDPGNLTVKYLPIDYQHILRQAAQPCPVKHSGNRPLIVSVGRLDPEKQFPMLLKTCGILRKDVAFDLWIIGDGKERQILEDYIAGEKLDFVHLLGAQTNPYPYLAQADLFVSSSRTESYGLAVQEALILGIPVVAVRCPGIEESLDARFGILTDNNAEALADPIRTLLQNPDELRRYRDAVAGQFELTNLFEKRMKAIMELWEEPAEKPVE